MRTSFVICALLVISLPAFAGNSTVVNVDDWSFSEPLAGFDLDDGVLTLNVMDRMTGGQIDEPATLLRTLAYANPGLLQQLATEALKRANVQDILSDPSDASTLTQDQIDQLNEVLRRLVHDELRSSMSSAKHMLDRETLITIGSTLDIGSREQQILQQSNLRVSTPWYQVSTQASTTAPSLSETTMCEPNNGGCGSGGVFCPGMCVAGCDPPASNCTSVTVPIELRKVQWRY